MPLNYSTPQVIVQAKSAVQIFVTAIQIRTPIEQPATVTYYYTAVDGKGLVVDTSTITVPLAQIQTEKPQIFAAFYAALKEDGYSRFQAKIPGGQIT